MLVALLLLSDGGQIPSPPYKRTETAIVFENAYQPDWCISGSTFMATNRQSIVAFDLAMLKRSWFVQPLKGEQFVAVTTSGGIAYGASMNDGKAAGRVVAVNARTGKMLWQIPRTGRDTKIAADAKSVYVNLTGNTVSRIDVASHRPVWTAKLPKASLDGIGGVESLSATATGVLGNFGSTTFCLDPATGKLRWSEPQSYVFSQRFAIDRGVVWVPSGEGSKGREITTGQVLWHSDRTYGDGGFAMPGWFVGISDGRLNCLDSKTGKEVWSNLIGPVDTSGGNQSTARLTNLIFAVGIDKALVLRTDGHVLWQGSTEEGIPEPVWSNGTAIVSFDGKRLIRYVHGEAEPLPTTPATRLKAVQQLVKNFDKLDDADQRRLIELKPESFQPLLNFFLEACHAHDAMGDKGDSYPLYSKFHDIGDLLMKVTTPADTDPLIAALSQEKPKSSAKPVLLTLLAQFGKPETVTPYFLAELDGVKTPGFEMYESNTYVAREYISASSDLRAVAFMLKQLRSPKADETLRYEAYVNLARTGGEEGLRAVMAERNRRTLLRPLDQRVLEGFVNSGETGSTTKAKAQKQDATGRTWGLIESGVIGSSGDLWLVEQVDGKWAHPLFTGVSTSAAGGRRGQPAGPVPTFAGKTAKQLLDGAWFDVLVSNEEIRKDSDGDGLTDLVEKRLGTDLLKADTDGDGDNDQTDPWPNAANRTLTDEEQVVAAAFEARYHFDDSEGPGLFTPPANSTPFEMPGRRGTMIWTAEGAKSLPLANMWEQGTAFISISGAAKDTTWNSVLGWNADHTEANFIISTYFGGLNGTGYRAIVRKFGNDWVVVSMKMEFVS